MNEKIEVFDNYLDKENFTKIKELPFKLDWKFLDHKVNALDGHCQFVHLFYRKGQELNSFNLLSPLTDKMKMKAISRIKANLTLKSNSIKQYEMHVDESNILGTLGSFVNKDNNNELQQLINNSFNNLKTAIYYINTNNGKTVFENGQEVQSKENRLVVFSGKLFHAGTTHTDTPFRSVINFNYYD